MQARYDLSGRLTLTATGGEEALAAIARLLRPFTALDGTATAAGETEVILEEVAAGTLAAPAELQGPAGDGLTTAWDGAGVQVVLGGRRCSVPDVLAGPPVHLRYEAGLPLTGAFRTIVRPALQLALLHAGAAAVHATAVEADGGAVCVAGWSESGKTEVALGLMEDGARFVSDKWTVVGLDGQASAFPIGVGIRRWVLDALPRLEAGLPRRARSQLRVAAAAGAVSQPVRRGSGRVAQLAGRAVALADRAALTPDELHAIYGGGEDPGRRLPLRALVLLETAPSGGPTVTPADPAVVAARLARTAAYERRGFHALGQRARYAAPGIERHDDAEAVIAREQSLLTDALRDTLVLSVRTPFPADPRPIASAIADRL